MRDRHGYAKCEVMPTETPSPKRPPGQGGKAADASLPLTSAAERALAEAAARHAERDAYAAPVAPETGGRGGLEPTRFGDWEINGLTSDF